MSVSFCLPHPVVVHQPASPSIWPAVQSLRRGMSTNPGVTMWLLLKSRECYRCDLASTLCKYDLRKDDLFVLSWARV